MPDFRHIIAPAADGSNPVSDRRQSDLEAHNIIQGGGPAAQIEGPLVEPIWRDNTVWDTPAGLMPEEGFTKKKPAIKALKPLTVEDW